MASRTFVMQLTLQNNTLRPLSDVAKQLTAWLRMSASNSPFALAPYGDKELINEKLLNNCDDEALLCMAVIGSDVGADVLMYGHIERREQDGQTVFKVSLKVLSVAGKSVSNSMIETVPLGELTSRPWSRPCIRLVPQARGSMTLTGPARTPPRRRLASLASLAPIGCVCLRCSRTPGSRGRNSRPA
jgi:hypothetical protein